MQEYTNIISDITTGKLDSQLQGIISAIRNRNDSLARCKSLQFQLGDAVRLNNNVNPQYLVGAKAKVVGFGTKKIKIRLDVPQGRFTGIITTPASYIDKI